MFLFLVYLLWWNGKKIINNQLLSYLDIKINEGNNMLISELYDLKAFELAKECFIVFLKLLLKEALLMGERFEFLSK